MKMMKKVAVVLGGFAACCVLGVQQAEALPQDSFTLSLTIGNQLSVNVETDAGVDITNYNFGTMSLGQTSVNTTNIDLDNDSGGLTQTYQLSIGDSAAGLILRATTGVLATDEYRVQALFQNAQPAHGDFASEDILTTAAQTAQVAGASNRFATASVAALQDGVTVTDGDNTPAGVTGGAEIRLWLRLELAATSTLSGAQSNFATVFVNAL